MIQVEGEHILFDAGRGVVLQMVRAGIPLASVNPVFITHHHVDHIGDLYDVMLSTWMYGRKEALRIYGPPETKRIADTLLTQVYDKDWQWRSIGEPSFGGWKPVIAKDILPGLVLDTDRWKVSAEIVNHGDGLGFPPEFLKRWICYGYRLEAEGKVVVISGDTIPCEGIDRLAYNADVLVHCCYMASVEAETEHFRKLLQHTMSGGDTVGKTAARANAKTLVLTHHRPRSDDGMLEKLAEEVARDFPGRIIIGEDLTEIDV
jgi:ribonuclease Z